MEFPESLSCLPTRSSRTLSHRGSRSWEPILSTWPRSTRTRMPKAHLQFRISDLGRYGVRTRRDSIILYRYLRENEPSSTTDPGAIAHCPSFPISDNPIYREVVTCTFGSQGCTCPAQPALGTGIPKSQSSPWPALETGTNCRESEQFPQVDCDCEMRLVAFFPTFRSSAEI